MSVISAAFLSIAYIVFESIDKSLAIGRVCRIFNRSGMCLPAGDCYGEAATLWDTCGRNVCCLDPLILRNKCLEYQKVIFEKGSNYNTPKNQIQRRIIGGELANDLEFPYMAAVGNEGNGSGIIDWKCGGTLISPNYVLTAGHCIIMTAWSTWILAGSIDLTNPEAQIRRTSRALMHPRYNAFRTPDDLALLHVEDPFVLSESIAPGCLLFEHEYLEHTKGIASGWGKINEEDDKGVKTLRKVELEIIELNDCKKYYKILLHRGEFTPSLLCAGHIPGGKDECQGDSGGPLATSTKKSTYSFGILGISSSGNGCGGPNSPGIYIRISYYLTWITSKVWPETSAKP